MKKIFKVIRSIVTVFLIFMLLVIVTQKISKNNFAIGGIRVFTIVSGSMKPKYQNGDILISKAIPAKDIKIGDHITYLGKKNEMAGLVVTHEVIEKREENGEYYFTTKGIANSLPDPEICAEDIYGKIIYKTVVFSFFGRAMNNIVIYYLLFVTIGVYFSYQIISGFIMNKKEDDESGVKEELKND